MPKVGVRWGEGKDRKKKKDEVVGINKTVQRKGFSKDMYDSLDKEFKKKGLRDKYLTWGHTGNLSTVDVNTPPHLSSKTISRKIK